MPDPTHAVLLDMDGVLVDVHGSFRRAVRETVAHFTGAEPSHATIQALKDGGGYNNDWVLSHRLAQDGGSDASFEAIRAHFQTLYLGERHAEGVFDGLIATEPPAVRTETLEALAARYPLALVTGRPEADAAWTLRRFAWDRLVPVVIGMGAQGERGKPDPYGLHLALDALGVPAERALFAGDTVDDVAAARAAGAVAVGVIPPGADAQAHGATLRAAGAAHVLASAAELPALAAELWGR